MENALYYLISAALVIGGVIATLIPVLPAGLLVFAGLFLAAWANDFTRVGAVGLTIIAALALLSLLADLIASLLGAKRVGASPQALVGAAVGSALGVFFGLPGLVMGPFIGALLGEYLARGRLIQAGRVGIGTWLGLVAAAIAKVVIAFLMITVFLAIH